MEYRKLKDLKKLKGNPRVIKDKQFKTLCESIRDNKEYFEARPLILSDRTGELIILAGNQRYEAAKSLKMVEAPTFLIQGLTEEKEREIIIRDNVSNGDWNFDILANEWDDLPLDDWGVDLPGDGGGGRKTKRMKKRGKMTTDAKDLTVGVPGEGSYQVARKGSLDRAAIRLIAGVYGVKNGPELQLRREDNLLVPCSGKAGTIFYC